jgi:hypothetical protein
VYKGGRDNGFEASKQKVSKPSSQHITWHDNNPSYKGEKSRRTEVQDQPKQKHKTLSEK